VRKGVSASQMKFLARIWEANVRSEEHKRRGDVKRETKWPFGEVK
jgi:hypothetical protein